MERGMRLKVESPMVLLNNRLHSIHVNGLDGGYNRTSDNESTIAKTQLIHSTGWVDDFQGRGDLRSNENYKLQQTKLIFRQQHSPARSLADDEDSHPSSGSSSSASDSSPDLEDYRSLSQSSDTESDNPRPPSRSPRGIVNPNYPGFDHFASQLLTPGSDSDEDTSSLNNINNNNNTINNNTEAFKKNFYDKPKFNTDELNELNIKEDPERDIRLDLALKMDVEKLTGNNKMADAFLSGVKEEIRRCEDTNRIEGREKSMEEGMERDVKDKMEVDSVKKIASLTHTANNAAFAPPANQGGRAPGPRRPKEKKKNTQDIGSFDVYNIETAMPIIDLDAIENHLKAAREEERRVKDQEN